MFKEETQNFWDSSCKFTRQCLLRLVNDSFLNKNKIKIIREKVRNVRVTCFTLHQRENFMRQELRHKKHDHLVLCARLKLYEKRKIWISTAFSAVTHALSGWHSAHSLSLPPPSAAAVHLSAISTWGERGGGDKKGRWSWDTERWHTQDNCACGEENFSLFFSPQADPLWPLCTFRCCGFLLGLEVTGCRYYLFDCCRL